LGSPRTRGDKTAGFYIGKGTRGAQKVRSEKFKIQVPAVAGPASKGARARRQVMTVTISVREEGCKGKPVN